MNLISFILLNVFLLVQAACQGHCPVDLVEVAQDAPALPSATTTVDDQSAKQASESSTLPPELDALLDRLEAGSNDLTGFTAFITYEKYEDVLRRKEIRSGEIIYRVEAETNNKSFAILFDRLQINRRRNNRLKHFIFDGRWLVEIDHEAKQFIKRELVAPGQKFDPLKLGEGPIPLPIGQAKQDVLDRFDVQAATLPAEGRLAALDADTVDGIRLVPLPETAEADEFVHIDLFYDKSSNLPVGIDAVELNGDSKTVLLEGLVRNPEFTPDMLKKLDITNPDPKEWRIDIQPWQGVVGS